MIRTVYINSDGYLMEMDGETASPVLCWAARERFCCDTCAAFRVVTHLDSAGGTTKDADFVECAAMGDRGATIGRIE